MSFIYYKTPDEIEKVGIDFNDRLGDGDEVISGKEVITDVNGTDVTTMMMVTGSEAISDTDSDGTDDTITIKVKAGTDEENYKLMIVATTTNGEKKEEMILIKVREPTVA